MTFTDWLAAKIGTRNWVVAKRSTPKLTAKYSLILKPTEFCALRNEYEYFRLFSA